MLTRSTHHAPKLTPSSQWKSRPLTFQDNGLYSERMTKHGMSGTPTYQVWSNMIQRCLNPEHPRFKDWGGRGITICQRWLTFQCFYDDMGEKPAGMSIERTSNNEGYSPDNCIWASTKDQLWNRRNTITLMLNGTARKLRDLVPPEQYKQAAGRLHRGWPIENILSGTPPPARKHQAAPALDPLPQRPTHIKQFIKKQRSSGLTFLQIGQLLSVSKQRVHQIYLSTQ